MRTRFLLLAGAAMIGGPIALQMPVALKGIETVTNAYANANNRLRQLNNPEGVEAPATPASAVITDEPRDLSSHAVRRVIQRYQEPTQP